jgi:hypothetical protein
VVVVVVIVFSGVEVTVVVGSVTFSVVELELELF